MCFCKTVCTTHVQLVSEESPGKSLSKLPEMISLPVSSVVEKNLTVGTDSNRNFDESNRNFLQKVGITIKQVN